MSGANTTKVGRRALLAGAAALACAVGLGLDRVAGGPGPAIAGIVVALVLLLVAAGAATPAAAALRWARASFLTGAEPAPGAPARVAPLPSPDEPARRAEADR